jgi:hypothetical protein
MLMNIVVHFRKNRFFLDISLIGFVALLFGAISYLLTYVKIDPALLLFGILLFGTWPWFGRVFCIFVFHQPALIINNTGIRLFPVHIPSNFFISWPDIQKISIEQYDSTKCMCVSLKDEKRYLSSLSPFRRFSLRLWRRKRQPVMNIALFYLDQPAIEIFQQISERYASELNEYNVQLQL